jgi:hypothetical protein
MQQQLHAPSTLQAADPFGMLIDPLGAQRALAASQQRLESLNRRICRPLDRVTTTPDAKPGVDREVYDAEVDSGESAND